MSKNKFTIESFNGQVSDVFHNSFDITWFDMYGDASLMPKTFGLLPIESAEDDGTVEYSYNSDYFRSDEFISDHSGTHMLFAGCSQTEGVGAPLETVWTKTLYNELSKDKKASGFFSIAKAGYGWQKVISNFMLYVEKYGHPEYLFVLLPNAGRFFDWDTEANCWRYVQRYPTEFQDLGAGQRELPPSVFSERIISIEEHRRSFIDFTLSWRLFEKYCESNSVKMLWGSWDYGENANYLKANASKNYIHLTNEELLEFIVANRPDGKMGQFDLGRRDGHAGIVIHEYWHHKFLSEIKKRGWAND